MPDAMRYAIHDIELSQPLPLLEVEAQQDGWGLLLRWKGKPIDLWMLPTRAELSNLEADLGDRISQRCALRALAAEVEIVLDERWSRPTLRDPPSLTIAICTKDRPARLSRLLASVVPLGEGSPFGALEILVVDNASTGVGTYEAVRAFEGVRYVRESLAGLDFARNTALRSATGALIAYLDDDVVVDKRWLDGLYAVWADWPDAGGYTGLVLPYRLDTAARIEFERQGGFAGGFSRVVHGSTNPHNPLFPVGTGIAGSGCNMCFDRQVLLGLGGFDEALDTGAPLPGGGDLDIFYRVVRSGRVIVYEPRFAVFHEHRETLRDLRHQYWTWGLGFMAFLVKSWRTDPEQRPRHSALVRWWFRQKLRALAAAGLKLRWRRATFVAAELAGAVQGLAGEYDRSLERSRRIRERTT